MLVLLDIPHWPASKAEVKIERVFVNVAVRHKSGRPEVLSGDTTWHTAELSIADMRDWLNKVEPKTRRGGAADG